MKLEKLNGLLIFRETRFGGTPGRLRSVVCNEDDQTQVKIAKHFFRRDSGSIELLAQNVNPAVSLDETSLILMNVRQCIGSKVRIYCSTK